MQASLGRAESGIRERETRGVTKRETNSGKREGRARASGRRTRIDRGIVIETRVEAAARNGRGIKTKRGRRTGTGSETESGTGTGSGAAGSGSGSGSGTGDC